MIHSEMMFLHILHTYFILKDTTYLDIETFQKAFYTFQDIINDKLCMNLCFDFYEELTKFTTEYSEVITYNEDNIEVADDNLDLLFYLINANVKLTVEDALISEFINDFRIFRDLNEPVDLKSYESLFNLNDTINKIYRKIARYEIKNNSFSHIIPILNHLIDSLQNKLIDLRKKDFIILEACIRLLNAEIHLDIEENYCINEDWYIALFSQHKPQARYLNFCRLFVYLNEMHCKEDSFYEIQEDAEHEDLLEIHDDSNKEDSETQDFAYPYDNIDYDETKIFISYFFVLLKDYINEIDNNSIKEKLIMKKYQLLSLPILEHIEEYFLNIEDLNLLDFPPIFKDNYRKESFDNLFPTTIERVLSLDYKDALILKDNSIEESIIISCLFIRSFLTLSVNQDKKDQVITLIKNSSFYKNSEYLIVNKMLEEIVFNEKNLKLTK